MNPRQFEEFVCEHFRKQGYETELTTYSNDYGIDGFAIKGKQKIAIQSKMYGHTTRKINRQTVMELHGAKDFFDCTKAVIATDGVFLQDALVVAKKLKIDILYLKEIQKSIPAIKAKTKSNTDKTFEQIWEDYIIPLQGKTIVRNSGETNQIIKADWSGIERKTSNGNNGKIKIEIFKQAVNKLLTDGSINRDYINQNYVGRASSGIILILSQVPFFKLTEKPSGLKYQN
ncbi:MAG: restriction endonuclease [Bacteroidetes bacterium]|nr:restriction endonuclease [Bacteroidota bacterium]MBU1483919.1 restriction endonuclease [Bacteroidota bacterium]MBU1759229.1 restriction endonuclease [Bacteroidota bacterium]MBU2266916.1 restriction endonuclease [Bacteroidota bacterium]MBU2377335.1 restriction endonuclease [Bacteroidota bacterium]